MWGHGKPTQRGKPKTARRQAQHGVEGGVPRREEGESSSPDQSAVESRPVKNVNPSTPLVYPNRRFHEKTLRQTQTPTVVAAPQLLTSLQCQIKELVPPRLLSARQTPSFLSRRHTQRNRSTRTRAGTRPQPTNKERKQDVPVWLLSQVP